MRLFGIHAPLSRVAEVEPLLAAGADGFYAGIFPSDRIGRSPIIINRRNHPENNFRSAKELREAQSISHLARRELFVTFNEHFYPPEVLSMILEVLDELLESPGLTGVIVTDIGLIIELGRRFPQLVLMASTGCVIQNSGAASLFSGLGVKRAVVPRSMTLAEIDALVQSCPDMDFECFVLNDRCPNVDGLCHFVHADFTERRFPTQCRFVKLARFYPHRLSSSGLSEDATSSLSDRDFARIFGSEPQACGACYLPMLVRAGVRNMKIVGRDRTLDEKTRAVRFVAEARDLLSGGAVPYHDPQGDLAGQAHPDVLQEQEVLERIKALRRSLFDGACRPALCYFPEPPGPPSRDSPTVGSRSRPR